MRIFPRPGSIKNMFIQIQAYKKPGPHTKAACWPPKGLIEMCEKCEKLIKDIHVRFIASRAEEEQNTVTAGAALVYEKMLFTAMLSTQATLKKVDTGIAFNEKEFALAFFLSERRAIKFMLSDVQPKFTKQSEDAADEIKMLRMALELIQSQAKQSGNAKLEAIAVDALSRPSKFLKDSKEQPKYH